jgi:N-methylhydantoinase A/oxoprolinase/acetone carboxylase beta subunit
MRIGIDVGGTNTDAVLLDGRMVVAAVKRPTTPDVLSGIRDALGELERQHPGVHHQVSGVMIGTTHFVNALVQGKGLARTACLRLGLPATSAVPPMTGWPDRVRTAISGRAYLAHGGVEIDGRKISDVDPGEIARICADMAANGIESVAISSVFSPVNAECERQAAQIVAAELGPGVAVSLSHEIGRIGLLERENATVINASLRLLADQIVTGLAGAVRAQGLTAPLFLSQNDGTLMDADRARRYPVATFASGPTNSMRGAAALSGLEDCAVVDVGGTTTDVGVLAAGFPRVATTQVEVAGIRTNFRMPDVLSVGIGGGSLVVSKGIGGTSVGPVSVGYELATKALVFGGDVLTATDIAVAAGRADIGDPSLVRHLDPAAVRGTLRRIAAEVAQAVDRMRLSADPLPVVAVGGGSILVPDELDGLGDVLRPDNFAVANAIGAAIAQVSGEVDRVYSVPAGRRGAVLDEARQEAVGRAVAAGAAPATVEVVELDEVPIQYLPGDNVRIRVKAVGELAVGMS